MTNNYQPNLDAHMHILIDAADVRVPKEKLPGVKRSPNVYNPELRKRRKPQPIPKDNIFKRAFTFFVHLILKLICKMVSEDTVRPEVQIRIDRSKIIRVINNMSGQKDIDKFWLMYYVFHDKHCGSPELFKFEQEFLQAVHERKMILNLSKVQ